MAARLAHDALAISADNLQARLLYLTAMLDESAYRRGLAKAAESIKIRLPRRPRASAWPA